MNSVYDAPAKRRKLTTSDISTSHTYDSQDDSGDDIFAEYETVATLPIAVKPNITPQNTTDLLSSPLTYVTQPTQLVRRATPEQDDSVQEHSIVQVPASSPARNISPNPAKSKHFPGGRLASSMAPAGTTFRPPNGVIRTPAIPVVDISDDEPFVRGASSDSESESGCRGDIKPSTFTYSSQKRGSKAVKVGGSFEEILSNSFYKPLNSAEKIDSRPPKLSGSADGQRDRIENRKTYRVGTTSNQSGDTMANAYGATRRPLKQVKQTGPAKALPATELEIDDIEDYQLRSKISRMRQILPYHTVRACKDALERKRYNFDDAMELLASQEIRTKRDNITTSDGEESLSNRATLRKAPAKQQIKAPNLKIQDKWTATQARSTQDPVPLMTNSPTTSMSKPRRRLIQGRKRQSSPIAASKQASPIPSSRTATPDADGSDSGVGTGVDSELDHRVLRFFNTCSIPDLVDLAGITEEVASELLSQKPFGSLDDIRQVSSEVPGKTKTKRKMTRKPFGDKIVDKCSSMLTGYEAVDELVKRCEELAKPVKEDMKGWGVNVFGAATEGELEIVNLERDLSPRDSAIGTPNSIIVSDEEGVLRRPRKHAFFPQPLILAKGIELKDYQVKDIQKNFSLSDSSKEG